MNINNSSNLHQRRSFRIIRTVSCVLAFCIFQINAIAQIEVTSASSPPFDPISLIKDQFLGEGIELVDIKFEGVNSSVGYFSNGSGSVGLDNGILLTTGVVNSQGADNGVNESGSVQASADNGSTATDVDLDGLSAVKISNLAKYTIEFIPTSDTLSFRYVFASEEYPEFVCSDYNDIFGFFISGPGINGTFDNSAINIATIPGTNLPVTINNVNGGTIGAYGNAANCSSPNGSLGLSEYFVDNEGSASLPVFDGWLTPFEAKVAVQPCETYTIKIVIADQGDEQRDSGVFLEAKSFGSENVSVDVTVESLDGSIVEGCSDADLTFKLKAPRAVDTEINLSFIGDATMGSDYSPISPSLTIPAGEISATITINALEDGQGESLEELKIATVVDQCRKDTITLFLRDAAAQTLNIRDTIICEGGSVSLDATISANLVPITRTKTSGQAIISALPNSTPPILVSSLDVSGIDFQKLGPGMIQSICINLDHNRVEDLNIYLRSPGGHLMTLSSGNGGMGDNYTGTCFTFDATNTIISGSAPFTGNWLAEEDISNLWNGYSTVNGQWQLEIVDEKFGFNGMLRDWSITFNASQSYSYNWNNTPGLSCYDCPNPTASPTETQQYALTITDAFGCTINEEVTVNVAAAFGEAGDNQSVCSGTSTNLLASGGTDYQWSTGDVTAGITVTPLTTTTYYVNVTNATNCSSVDSVTVVVNGSLSSTLDKTDISCHGLNNGSITANSTGTAPLTYAWDNGDNTQTITGLSTGEYKVTITDAAMCSAIDSINIIEPELLILSSTGSTTCEGRSEGTGTVFIQSGGVSPFGNQWDSNAGDQTTAVANNLAAGSYDVTVTDSNMCTATETVVITELDTIATPSVSCGNISSSEITFVWSPDPDATGYMVNVDGSGWVTADDNQSHQVTGLALGQEVTIEVQGVGSCSPPIGSGTCATINCTPITFSTPIITDVLCQGMSTGIVELTASGDNPPFTYSLNGTSNNNTGRFTALSAGSYVVSVKDDIGCSNSINFTIEEPTQLEANGYVVEQPRCDPASGSVSVMTTGGTAPYAFNWGDGATLATVENLPGGSYDLTVTDSNMCTTTTSVTLDAYVPMTLSIDLVDAGCSDSDDGAEATAQVSSGTAPYTFLWNDEVNQTTQTAVELEPGDYMVTVTDSDMCTIVESTTVSRPDIDFRYTVEPPLCADEPGSILLEPVLGQAPFSVSFNDNQFNGQLEFENVPSGTYAMTVTDANDCSQTISDIVIPTKDAIEIMRMDESLIIALGDSVEFQPQVINSTGTVTFDWSITDMSWLSCATCPIIFAKPTQTSVLNLEVMDDNGCVAIQEIDLLVDRRRKVYIPNAISPNNDGMNDFFTVFTNGDGMISKMMIFDRWGNMVFERDDMVPNESQTGWDGTFNQRDVDNNRLFTYVIMIRFDDGEEKTYDGSFIVVR